MKAPSLAPARRALGEFETQRIARHLAEATPAAFVARAEASVGGALAGRIAGRRAAIDGEGEDRVLLPVEAMAASRRVALAHHDAAEGAGAAGDCFELQRFPLGVGRERQGLLRDHASGAAIGAAPPARGGGEGGAALLAGEQEAKDDDEGRENDEDDAQAHGDAPGYAALQPKVSTTSRFFSIQRAIRSRVVR